MLDSFGYVTWIDLLVCFTATFIFWSFLYLHVFKKQIAEINYNINETVPTAYFNTFGVFLINSISFVYDDFDWVSNILRFTQQFYTIVYNIMDSSYYVHEIVWLIHHLMAIVSAISCVFTLFINVVSNMASIVELGSFFFLIHLIYKQTNAYVSFICILFNAITRIYWIHLFVVCLYYTIDQTRNDNYFAILCFLFPVTLTIILNIYLLIQNTKFFISTHVTMRKQKL